MAQVEKVVYEIEAVAKTDQARASINSLADDAKKASGSVSSSLGGAFSGIGDKLKSGVGSIKDTLGGLGGLAGGLAGGAIFAGVTEGLSFALDKAKEFDDAQDQLSVALAKTGLSGAAAAEEMKRLGQSGADIADAFALPTTQVTALQATITGFSGATGKQLDDLTELSLGASAALGMSAESVARLIAKGADPEQEASLKKLGIQFDKNATAAERMAQINRELGPSIQAAKDANDDAFGSFDRIKNKIGDFVGVAASGILDTLKPAFDIIGAALGPVIDILGVAFDITSFLVRVGFEMAIWPVRAALAFKDWLLSLGPVKDALATVGNVITTVKESISEIIDTVSNVGDSLLSLIGLGSDEAAVSKEASAALAEKAAAEKAAADATEKHAEALRGAIDAMEDEQKQLKEGVDEARKRYLLNQQIANDPTRDEATRAQAKAYLQDNINFAKSRQDKINLQKKFTDDFNKEINASADKEKKTRAAATASAFEIEKARLDLEAKERATIIAGHENDLANIAVNEFVKGVRKTSEISNREAARLSSERIASLQKQRADVLQTLAKIDDAGNIVGLKVGVKKGEEAKSLAELKDTIAKINGQITSEEKNLIKLSPVLDANAVSRFNDNLEALLDKGVNSDIELGLRPKEDSFDLFDKEAARIRRRIAETNVELSLAIKAGDGDGIEAAKLKLVELTQTLGDIDAKRNEVSRSLTQELTDLRIAGIESVAERERQELAARQERELEYLNKRAASGIALNARELEEKGLIENKHRLETLALDKKQFEEQKAGIKAVADEFGAVFMKAFDTKGKLSDADAADQRKKFDDQAENLEKQLAAGAISQATYAAKIKDLNKDKADFIKSQDNSLFANFERAAGSAYDFALAKVQDYLVEKLETFAIETAAHLLMEESKSAATEEGSAARVISAGIEKVADLGVAAAKGVAAAAAAAYNAIVSLPFPLDIAAAAASAASIVALIGGLTGAIKFETGGLGLVGEKGPEIIGPTKDFSQFATQLVMQTVKATEAALSGNQNGGSGQGRSGRMDVRLGGRAVLRGRDAEVQLVRESISARTEVIGTAL